jgi:hypothetical protein
LKLNFRAVLILLATLLLVTSGHFFGMPVHAAKTPTLYISPSNQSLVAAGSTITYNVNVSNIDPLTKTSSGNPIYGWAILIETNNSVLTPISVKLGPVLPDALTSVLCINDLVQPGSSGACDIAEGPGVVDYQVYSAAAGSGSAVNGTLFSISYTAKVDSTCTGCFSLVSFKAVQIPNAGLAPVLYDIAGSAITGVTAHDGSYGNVPALPLASFVFSPAQVYEGGAVLFNATSSTTPPGTRLIDYSWTIVIPTLPAVFAKGMVLTHTFGPGDAGNWSVILTVRNDQGVVSIPTVRSLHVGIRPNRDLSIYVSQNFDYRILPGAILDFSIHVENVGTTIERGFNVSLSVPGQVFRAPPYPYFLRPKDQADFMFIWNTTYVQPGSYTVDANVAPLVGENDTANNDARVTLTFVPYLVNTDVRFSLEPTGPHQHELRANVFLQSGSGFAGIVTLSAATFCPCYPQSQLSIRFSMSTIQLTPSSLTSVPFAIDIGGKSVPGIYDVEIFAASGHFNFSTFFAAVVPSNAVRMPHLIWNDQVPVNGTQSWVATVVNKLPTPTRVVLDVSCFFPSAFCLGEASVVVPANSTTRLNVLFRPFDGFQIGQTFNFTATLTFLTGRGEFLSSDVRTGTFTVVP